MSNNSVLMNEKKTETIRVRCDEPMKKRVAKIAAKMSQELPAGSRKISIADVTRIALLRYLDNGK